MTTREDVLTIAGLAREAAAELAVLNSEAKNHALRAIADGLEASVPEIVAANALDLARAKADGTSPALIDRLRLDEVRIADIAGALRDVSELPDPVGDVVRGYTLPNGIEIRQVRCPLGVIGMIYEARPNVTVDAAGLCLKSGNAVLLRGSSSALNSNRSLVDVMRAALADTAVPLDAIQLVPGETHDSVTWLMEARGLVDVLIPRGGAGLIDNVVRNSVVPVIETGVGNCHVYVDKDVDVQQAVEVVLNSKTQRCSVCNAAETLLVHAERAEEFLPLVYRAFAEAGVTIHADERSAALVGDTGVACQPVTDEDWAAEYYSFDIAVGVVDDLEAACRHIRRWTSGHTESILSTSAPAIQRFIARMDSAVVAVNASTRFTDGGRFGFGAEIGISTQKLHARGPMGLPELTSTKYVLVGDGHVV